MFTAVYRFCHDTVQPPLDDCASVLAEHMRWLPEERQPAAVAMISNLLATAT